MIAGIVAMVMTVLASFVVAFIVLRNGMAKKRMVINEELT